MSACHYVTDKWLEFLFDKRQSARTPLPAHSNYDLYTKIAPKVSHTHKAFILFSLEIHGESWSRDKGVVYVAGPQTKKKKNFSWKTDHFKC